MLPSIGRGGVEGRTSGRKQYNRYLGKENIRVLENFVVSTKEVKDKQLDKIMC